MLSYSRLQVFTSSLSKHQTWCLGLKVRKTLRQFQLQPPAGCSHLINPEPEPHSWVQSVPQTMRDQNNKWMLFEGTKLMVMFYAAIDNCNMNWILFIPWLLWYHTPQMFLLLCSSFSRFHHGLFLLFQLLRFLLSQAPNLSSFHSLTFLWIA